MPSNSAAPRDARCAATGIDEYFAVMWNQDVERPFAMKSG
jgi:hypothetical protein